MLIETFRDWIGYHKALELWFHNAHHSVRGGSFAGDHAILYDNLYTVVFGDSFDGVVERGIGLTDDQSLADAVEYAINAHNRLKGWPTPSSLSAEQLAAEGVTRITEYLDFLQWMRESLEFTGELTLGLDDMIAGMCDVLETETYKLKQRSAL
jgi:hypothetical protein